MSQANVQAGNVIQADDPEWDPLLNVVGTALIGDFMWMFEIRLADGTSVHAYKHIDTRRYLHLDTKGVAFVYEDRRHYRRVATAELLAAVLEPLLWLGMAAEAPVLN